MIEDKDKALFAEIEKEFCGYLIPNAIRRLPDGNIACVSRLAYTFALHLGVNKVEPYKYRFCFPSLHHAMVAFEQVQSVYDVPTFGWVAARPEGRIMLLGQLFHYTRKDAHYTDIEAAIASGDYNAATFEKWVCENKIDLDKGAIAFLEYLKGMEQ